MSTAAAHQPNYIPWTGYFYKMLYCDNFVFMDDVIMAKPTFTNRNRIKTKAGVLWLTVPCTRDYGETLIRDVRCADNRWKKKHVGTLEMSYAKAPYFETYMPRLREIIWSDEVGITDLNIRLVKQIVEWLGISCVFHMASDLKVSGRGEDRIINYVTRLGADKYISGYGGSNYQNEARFKEANINLVYYDFRPPVYPQLWGKFEPGLSIVDLLFNCGSESLEILKSSGTLRKE
jgi:hypothetical protein